MMTSFRAFDMPDMGGRLVDLAHVNAPAPTDDRASLFDLLEGLTPAEERFLREQLLHFRASQPPTTTPKRLSRGQGAVAPPSPQAEACRPRQQPKTEMSAAEDLQSLHEACLNLKPAEQTPPSCEAETAPCSAVPTDASSAAADTASVARSDAVSVTRSADAVSVTRSADAVSVARSDAATEPVVECPDLASADLFPVLGASKTAPASIPRAPFKPLKPFAKSCFEAKRPAAPAKRDVAERTVVFDAAEGWEAEAARRTAGPKGHHLQAIEAATGARVSLRTEVEVSVLCRGPAAAVAAACAKVEAHFTRVAAEHAKQLKPVAQAPARSSAKTATVPTSEAWAGYEKVLLRRLVGQRGAAIKAVETAAACRVSMRGKGTPHCPTEPLHAVVTADEHKLAAAIAKVTAHFEEASFFEEA